MLSVAATMLRPTQPAILCGKGNEYSLPSARWGLVLSRTKKGLDNKSW